MDCRRSKWHATNGLVGYNYAWNAMDSIISFNFNESCEEVKTCKIIFVFYKTVTDQLNNALQKHAAQKIKSKHVVLFYLLYPNAKVGHQFQFYDYLPISHLYL